MIVVDNAAVLEYVQSRCDTKFAPPYTCVGFLKRDGSLGSGFVFYNYTRGNIEVALAAEPGGISRSALKAVCRYVFEQLGCRGMTALIEGKNRASVELAKRCGMAEKATIEDYCPDGDEIVILRMKRAECRWL